MERHHGKAQTIEIVVMGDCTYTAVFKSADTQITDLRMEKSNAANLYSMNGQLVRRNVTNLKEALRSLPDGLYIFNGHKVLNRK